METYTENRRAQAQKDVERLEKERQQALQTGDAESVAKLNRELATAKQNVKDWETSGKNKQIVETVSQIITSAVAGRPTAELATTSLSPLVNQRIKRATTDEKTGEVDKVTNTIAHAVWGAIEAAAGKGNVTAGAVSAAAAELAAPMLSKVLYDTDDPRKLTDEQKQNIVTLSALAGSVAGTAVGSRGADSTEILATAAKSEKIGREAVENNFVAPIFGNVTADAIPQVQGEIAKQELNQRVMEMIEREHPVIYKTMEGSYYFISKSGEVIYLTREIIINIAPFMIPAETLITGTGKLIQLSIKYPKATETFIAGSVATGFDIYNSDVSYEKTLMNYDLSGIKTGKSISQQLAIDSAYTLYSVGNDDSKSNNEKASEVIGKASGSALGIYIDNQKTGNGLIKQVISNTISNYTENKVSDKFKEINTEIDKK